jgi:hypothetical protein
MEREHDGFVLREERVKVVIAQTMRMFAGRQKFHQVHNVDDAIEMHVDEVQGRRRAPMPQQPRFDVFLLRRLFEQRIVVKIRLADGEIIGGAPPSVHLAEQVGAERFGGFGIGGLHGFVVCGAGVCLTLFSCMASYGAATQ